MSSPKNQEITTIHECLPKIGLLFDEDIPTTIICKPKLMPLKTVTLEKVIYHFEIIIKYSFIVLNNEKCLKSQKIYLFKRKCKSFLDNLLKYL
jgi:hypothetical protein